MTDRELKARKKRAKFDRQRNLRVVEYLDYSQVFESSPVEITEGYVVSDVDDYSLFASFVFLNVSGRDIRSLTIRLLCYSNQNIPYLKIPFEYSFEEYTFGERRMGGERIKDKAVLRSQSIGRNETFGEAVYIPIPESYFKKLELEITEVTYSNGDRVKLSLIAGKTVDHFPMADFFTKRAYDSLNIYVAAEEKFPIRVLPQAGENAWLCCCGQKNPNSADCCEQCKRERDWQLANIAADKIDEVRRSIIEEHQNETIDRTNYSQNKYLESDEEIQRKIKQYETAMHNVAAEEKARESRRVWFIPKLLLAGAAIWLLVSVLSYLWSVINV